MLLSSIENACFGVCTKPPHAIIYNGKSRFWCMPTCQLLKVILINKCFRSQLSQICCKLQYKSRHLQTEGNHLTSENAIKTICAKHILRSSSHYKHSLFHTPLNQNQIFSISNSIHATKSIGKTICAKLLTFTKHHYLQYSSSKIVQHASWNFFFFALV